LDEVRVQVIRQPGHGLPARRVSLSGRGEGTLERKDVNLAFPYPAEKLVSLINDLYRIRFFTLPVVYTPRLSVAVQDGVLVARTTPMADALATRVCFTAGTYERCVTYRSDGGFTDLESLVERVFAEAEELAGSR
jgi:hypothetical protein